MEKGNELALKNLRIEFRKACEDYVRSCGRDNKARVKAQETANLIVKMMPDFTGTTCGDLYTELVGPLSEVNVIYKTLRKLA